MCTVSVVAPLGVPCGVRARELPWVCKMYMDMDVSYGEARARDRDRTCFDVCG